MIKTIFIGCFILSSPFVHAACGLSIVANNLSQTWDLNWAIKAISIQISKTDPGACTFGLGFSQGGAGSYTRYAEKADGSQLKYQFYQDAGATKILKDVPDLSSANDVIMVTMPAGSPPVTQIYYFDVPYATAVAPTLASSGTYTDTITINAYEGADFSSLVAPPDATASVNVSIAVDKMVNIALVDTGGVFQETATTKSIEFGELTTGKTARFDMVVRTNAGASVTVESLNSGRLKHTTKNSYVDYTLYVNNVAADPTGATPVLTGPTQTALVGIGYPVKVVIGTVNALSLAGPYADTVTITATATE